jgi:NitT/TauT family transport system permease protein
MQARLPTPAPVPENPAATPPAAVTRPRRRRLTRARLAAWRRTALVLVCQVALAALLLALWEWSTASHALSAFLFGSPSAIWGFLVQMWRDGSLVRDTSVTALETLLGFALGNVIGMVIGLSLWYSRFVARVVQPFVVALGSIPIIALAPIVIIWFGTELASKVAMAVLSVVVVALVISYKGAMSIDPDQVNLMRSLRATKTQVFRKLVIPASLGDLFAGLKMTVGFALVGAIVGEFMSSHQGLGHAIFKAGSLYIIPKVFAALVATIALALFLTYVVGKLERLLLPWRHDV